MSSCEIYEDHLTESRILSDAELLKDGAHVQLGKLVVTEYQYEKARLAGDALFDVATNLSLNVGPEEFKGDFEPEPQLPSPTHPELDKSLDEAFQQVEDVKVMRVLKRYNISKVRDLLVVGRAKITEDLRGIGVRSVNRMEEMLAGETDIKWKDIPTVEDIAALCDDLSQVNAMVLLSKDQWFLGPMSIKQVLLTPLDERAETLGHGLLSSHFHGGYYAERQARSIYAAAEVFALQFDRVKNGPWLDPSENNDLFADE